MTTHSASIYLDLYDQHAALLASRSNAVMNERRADARARLAQYGLPTSRIERYKYTDAAAAFAPDYGVNLHRVCSVSDPYKTYRCSVPNLSAVLRFVVGDVVMPAAPTAVLPEGLRLYSFAEAAAADDAALLAHYYDRLARESTDGVSALNTLLTQDGLVVHLAAGTHLKSPLQIVNISAADLDMLSSRRLLIVAEAGASADILICDHSAGEHQYVSTEVIEVFAGEGSHVGLYTLEETHTTNRRFCHTFVEQAANSHVQMGSVALTSGLSRSTTDVVLRAAGARYDGVAAVIADAAEHIDHNVLVRHAAEGCQSDMLYKYVLDGDSLGAFAGKVLVEEGAQQTLSQMTNANLCVSPTARALSQPMLEIYADDVQCNHGSTIGRLDDAALFYLRQRGIAEAEARLLLQHAFINDVLQRIPVGILRERLAMLVERRFRGDLRCSGCALL